MLTPNPEHRITIDQVIAIIKKWDTFSQIPLNVNIKQFRNKLKELKINSKRNKENYLYMIKKQ